jgi:hypothetical protein
MFHFEASQFRTTEWGQYSCFVFGRPVLKYRSADRLSWMTPPVVFPIRLQKIVAYLKSRNSKMVVPCHFKAMYFLYSLKFLISVRETGTSKTRKWWCLCACPIVGTRDPSPGSTGRRTNHVISRRLTTSVPKSSTPTQCSFFATANSVLTLVYIYFRYETTADEYNQHYRLLYSYSSFFFTGEIWYSIEITNRCNCMQWILFLCLVHSTCFGRHCVPGTLGDK